MKAYVLVYHQSDGYFLWHQTYALCYNWLLINYGVNYIEKKKYKI